MTPLSRRHFLQGLTALSLSACSVRKPGIVPHGASGKVVVVGGGIAGLTAVKYLKLLAPSLDISLVEPNGYHLMCPGSNQVICDLRKFKELRHNYPVRYAEQGIKRIKAEAVGIDTRSGKVLLGNQSSLPYDRVIVAPGIDFQWKSIEGYSESASRLAPHAWKAGLQTMLLRRQLRTLPNGGVVIMTVPANPYRCPPGPYERASLMAHFLSKYKPRSKIIILDAKSQFSKQPLFEAAWKELYPGLIEWVSLEKEGRMERVDVEQLTVHTEFGTHKADVLNIIPPQKAGRIAHWMELVDESGWCPINPLSFESRLIPGIHVIGDACAANPMPKSAFAGQSQAINCAAAVVDLLRDREPGPPSLINHCYSFVTPDEAISITGIYEYASKEKALISTLTEQTPLRADRKAEARYAKSWLDGLSRDIFGQV
mgnify:CR=1 FL=1